MRISQKGEKKMKKENKSCQLSVLSIEHGAESKEQRISKIENPKSEIRNPKSAFTLIELLIVISIISILVTLLLPVLGSVQRTAKRTAMMSRLTAVKASCETFYTEYNQYPTTFADLTGTSVPDVVDSTDDVAPTTNNRKIKFYTGDIADDWTQNGGIGIMVDTAFDGKANALVVGATKDRKDGDIALHDELISAVGPGADNGITIGSNIPVVVYTQWSDEDGNGAYDDGEILTTMD